MDFPKTFTSSGEFFFIVTVFLGGYAFRSDFLRRAVSERATLVGHHWNSHGQGTAGSSSGSAGWPS